MPKVLCIKSQPVHKLASKQPEAKSFTKVLPYKIVLNNVELFSIERDDAETNYSYLQLLPYVLIKKGNKFLSYRRGRAGTEAKLHDKYSIGIGGHVDEGLDYFSESLNEQLVLGILQHNIARELDEEIGLIPADTVPLGCLVSQDPSNSTEVGWVHLGVVYEIRVPDDFEPKTKDEGMKEFRWLTVNELHAINLEPWSQAALDQLV